MDRKWSFYFLLIISSYVSWTNADCYDQNGVDISSQDPTAQACNQIKGAQSMCCSTNRTIPSGQNTDDTTPADICLPNGLCQNVKNEGGQASYSYWRGTCGSPTGEGCLKKNICPQDKWGVSTPLTPCDDTYSTTHWCCGQNASDCCSSWPHHEDAVTIPLVLASSSSPTHALVTITPSVTPHPGLSTGAKAGIGVGSAIGAVAIFAVGFLASHILAKKRERRYSVVKEGDSSQVPSHASHAHIPLEDQARKIASENSFPVTGYPREVSSERVNEMAANPERAELSALT